MDNTLEESYCIIQGLERTDKVEKGNLIIVFAQSEN